MDRDAMFWAARLLLGLAGVVLVFSSVRRLGRARAAATWPTAARVATLSIPLGWLGIGVGLLSLAGSVEISVWPVSDSAAAVAGPAELGTVSAAEPRAARRSR